MRRFRHRRFIIIVILFLITALLFHSRVEPLAEELAKARINDQASNILGGAINREIAENQIDYDDLVTLVRNEAGDITALRTNMQQMNLLKAHIMVQMEEEMYALDAGRIGIPLGNLTGLGILNGRGPKLPVKVLAVSSSGAEFYSEFRDAGINQTVHRIMMRVVLDLVLLLPGGTVSDQVYTDVCVAETVLLGQVPQWYQHNEYEKDE